MRGAFKKKIGSKNNLISPNNKGVFNIFGGVMVPKLLYSSVHGFTFQKANTL